MTTTPLTDQQLADTTSEALAEMHTAVEGIVRLFQQRCPEGFDASDVAAAIVDACSDELGPLYRDRAELGRVRAELATTQAQLWNLLAAAEGVHTVLHDLIVAEANPGARARAAWTALDTALIAARPGA